MLSNLGMVANDMWARIIANRLLRSRTFRFCILVGICSVVLDADHVATFGHPQRWLHLPFLIISGFILCCCLACVGGLYIKMVLRRRRGKV